MATITITIPDDKVAIVVAAYQERYNYPETVTDPATLEIVNNPESPAAFARRCVVEEIRDAVRLYRRPQAEAQAQTQLEEDMAGVTAE